MRRSKSPLKVLKKKRMPSNVLRIQDHPYSLNGAFRDNIRSFIRYLCKKEDYSVLSNPLWCFFLVWESNGVVFPFYVVEEHVSSSSPSPQCDLCRCCGWGHHFVSRRKYHFIIPRDDQWKKPLTQSALELSSHLLHCVVHCNGYGHLISINAGSTFLLGHDIMDVWDSLCTTLATLKISLHDVSVKGSMELRLLYGVAYGQPWFGKWGYKFSNGAFGVTQAKFNRAVQILTSLTLDRIIHDFKQDHAIHQIILFYRRASKGQLVTLSDLLRFMIDFKSKSLIKIKTTIALVPRDTTIEEEPKPEPEPEKTIEVKSFVREANPTLPVTLAPCTEKLDSRWPTRRLKEVAKVAVEILESHNGNVSRQELRDAVRLHIGDTGLIDFSLKHIDKIDPGGGKFVQRCINPVTKTLEFKLEKTQEGDGKVVQGCINPVKRTLVFKLKNTQEVRELVKTKSLSPEPGTDVFKDILYLYNNVLLKYPKPNSVSCETRILLDTKHFVKEWNPPIWHRAQTNYFCQVLPDYDELVNHFTRPSAPGVLLVASPCWSAEELKMAAQHALRDTYCIMERFLALDLKNGEPGERRQEEVLLVRGCDLDLETKLRYEGGPDDWIVNCVCGAKDDDGERMVDCDSCKVWHHTRCNGFQDDQTAPKLFLCIRCRATSTR